MKQITVIPIGGLCNRINAVTSAILYSQYRDNIQVKILWWKNHDCCASFSDLFKQMPFSTTIMPMNSIIKDRPGTRRNLYIPNFFRRHFYDLVINNGSAHSTEFDSLLNDNTETIYVCASNRFNEYCKSDSLAEWFIPTEELQERISSVIRKFNGNVVGLHIRRKDNVNSINQSPLSLFLDVMDKEIEYDSNVKFYVATDDYKIKEFLKSKYEKRILFNNLCLRRNSLQGMKDAVVDLWCLGFTRKIYGSAHSTYSLIASQLYNKELEILAISK